MDVRTHAGSAAIGITALAFLAFGAVTVEAQQMYRWVDKAGRVTYSQTPPPAGAATSVEQRKITSSVVEYSNLPYAAQVAAKNFPVTLFTSSDCADACKNGREMLSKRGIPFKEIVVGDEQSIELLRKLTGGNRVPALQVGAQATAGFEVQGWKIALDNAGYPSSIPSFARAPGPNKVQRNLPEVKLYATPDCGPSCQSAKDLLAARKVPFKVIVVQSDESLAELKKVAGAADIVPVLLVGGTSLKGFTTESYNSILDGAGFQQTATTSK